MISSELARDLREAGLRWNPAGGDAFRIDSEEFEADVFTVSDMTIQPHEFDTGVILGFNGTTEWALDSVAIENALWLPREDQLRELLGGTFRRLAAGGAGEFVVTTVRDELEQNFESDDASTSYAAALLALIGQSSSVS